MLCRAKDKEYDKDEEEDAYERKKQERKIREKEAVYQEVSATLLYGQLFHQIILVFVIRDVNTYLFSYFV